MLAQTTLNMSEDLVRLGAATTNMGPNQPTLDSGPLFLKAVQYATANHITSVIADPGSYYFLSVPDSIQHVALNQVTNVTINFQGSDLYFSHALNTGISLYSCTNVVIENFTIDYQPLPFTQVQVVSADVPGRRIQFSVSPPWVDPASFNKYQNTSGWDGAVEVHIFRNGQPAFGTRRAEAQFPFTAGQFTLTGSGLFAPTDEMLNNIRPGDVAVLALRKPLSALQAVDCSGCTIRNVTAYSSAGNGVSIAYSQMTTLERVNTVPRPGTDRLVSTFGQSFSPSGPTNVVRLSRAIRTMNDGFSFVLWVTGTVRSQPSSRSLVVEGTPGTTLFQFHSVTNGSPVAFQRPSDGVIVGSATMVSQIAPATTDPPYRVTFNFDRDLPDGLVGTDMYPTESGQRGENTVIERNAVENQTNCCRGITVSGYVNSVVRGNYVRRSAMTGVHITQHLDATDFQVPPVVNLGINNNVVDAANSVITGYGDNQLGGIEILAQQADFVPMATSPIQNVNVTANFVAEPGSAAVWVGNTAGGSANGNYFLKPNSNPAVLAQYAPFNSLITQPLVIEASSNFATTNNTVDLSSGRAWVTDTQYRELAAYAPGGSVRLNAWNLGQAVSPVVTLTDADGNTWPLPVRNTTTHALDVQIPSAAALGGAYVSLTAGAGGYFGTLFIDSQDNIPAANGCTYEASVSAASLGGAAGTLPILVVTQPGCSWQVLASDPFVSSGQPGSGTGIALVGFAANVGGPRSSTIEIAGQQITLTQNAIVPVIQGIYDAWDFTSGIAPGEWVAITGTNLSAGPAQTWDLTGVQTLPTTLGGVTVSFNGTPAALLYSSATQVNALVPASVAPGPVQVVVQSAALSGVPFNMTATAARPGIYAPISADGSAFYVTGVLAGTVNLVGNSNIDSRVVRGARSGDLLDIYMVGLGATADPAQFITDRLFAGAFPVGAPVTLTLDAVPVPVVFAGLVSPGLYLVRFTVPTGLAAGQHPIQVTAAGGSQTRSSILLTVDSPG